MNAVTVAFVLFAFVPFIACLPSPSQCPADKKEQWTYRGIKGPAYWGESNPTCYGEQQSPIDIDTENVEKDYGLPKLVFNNFSVPINIKKARIVNTGYGIQIVPSDWVERTINIDKVTYSFIEINFHWGDSYWKGAEHRIDGIRYAMEIQFVFGYAQKTLAIVGVVCLETEKNNPALEVVVKSLPEIRYKPKTAWEMKSNLDMSQFLPSSPASYYRYKGSMTTPPCLEIVTWSVLTKFLRVGKSQMREFRKLSSAMEGEGNPTNCPLSNNYRPTQPLNDRTVYLSQ